MALAGGTRWQLTDHVALAADVGGVVGADSADAVWGVGLQMGIPATPHSFSVHLSNANTSTLQGSSRAAGNRRWGFEFTVPITLSRFFGGSGGQTSGAAAVDPDAPAADVVVEMDNRLRFLPDTVRVPVGGVVEWRNTSDIVHTVTGDPERALRAENVALPEGAEPYDSGNLEPGARFRHTFEVAGTYLYVCVPHEAAAMVGVVIVE
jgi:plastocyanin